MNLLGLHPSMEEVEAMVAEIDTDGNGEVDFEEFLQVRDLPHLVSNDDIIQLSNTLHQ